MGMMGALMTPLLAVSLPWATPSPQPTVTVTQTASPVPSASGITAEQVAEVQHSFWFKALQWFLGVPLQIPLLLPILKAQADKAAHSFADFHARLPDGVPRGLAIELAAWTRRTFLEFRELELRLLLEKLRTSLAPAVRS